MEIIFLITHIKKIDINIKKIFARFLYNKKIDLHKKK